MLAPRIFWNPGMVMGPFIGSWPIVESTLRFIEPAVVAQVGTLRAGDLKGLPYSSWQILFPHRCQGNEHLSCLSFFSFLYRCQARPRAPGFMTSFSSTGRPHLAPPRNVTLLSQNFTVYLTWLPGLGSPPNVTYFVTYQRYRGASVLAGGMMEKWVRNGGLPWAISIQKFSGLLEGLMASP